MKKNAFTDNRLISWYVPAKQQANFSSPSFVTISHNASITKKMLSAELTGGNSVVFLNYEGLIIHSYHMKRTTAVCMWTHYMQ